MISATEGIADLDELSGQQLPCEIHGYLARCCEILGSRFRSKAVDGYSPLFGDGLLDSQDCQSGATIRLEALNCAQLVAERFTGNIDCDVLVFE